MIMCMFQTKLFVQTFILFMIVSFLNYLGVSFYLYWSFAWFDMVLHSLSGVAIGMATILVFRQIGIRLTITRSLVLVFVVGVLWEVFELWGGLTSLSDGMVYTTDTISDLLLDMLGGYIGFLYGKSMIEK
jgi:magnesium-transporting ATPase (P-type)